MVCLQRRHCNTKCVCAKQQSCRLYESKLQTEVASKSLIMPPKCIHWDHE